MCLKLLILRKKILFLFYVSSLIFLSCFSGDILEDEVTSPVLSYAKSKDYNEKQLQRSGKNYVILRLGSVYGFSTETMRTDIMPNLFSKITAQKGVLKLFSGGILTIIFLINGLID